MFIAITEKNGKHVKDVSFATIQEARTYKQEQIPNGFDVCIIEQIRISSGYR